MTGNSTSGRRIFWRGTLIVGVLAILGFAAVTISKSAATNEPGRFPMYIAERGDVKVTVIEQGGLESSNNLEIKCEVRGSNTVNWVIESGTQVAPGDVLVRLDTLAIEDAINERSKFAHWSRSGAERSKALLARSKLAVAEYLNGRYVSQLMALEKNLAISQSYLLRVTNQLEYAKKLSERGFKNDFEIEQREVAVEQAKLDVDARKSDIEILETYTKTMELKTLEGDLNSAQATHEANEERAGLDEGRRDQAKKEFELCVIKAEKNGLVIYPSAAAWKSSPDVTEGATVHKDQVLLLMPDLMKMQVMVGIHESLVDRIHPGMKARISIPGETIQGEVLSVASVARPAGWWTGNVVKYDTIIRLPENWEGLKPGMSAEVEIVIAEHRNVLKIPVSSILESAEQTLCWVKTSGGIERRPIEIGDSNDVFVVVLDGLNEGDEVVLDPVTFVEEAQDEALKMIDESNLEEPENGTEPAKPVSGTKPQMNI